MNALLKAALFAALCSLCASVFCTATSADKIDKSVHFSDATWTNDLRDYGYGQNWELVGLTFYRLRMLHSAAWFLNDKEIATAFFTPAIIEGLQRRENPNHARPWNFDVLIFDVTSGRLLNHLERPTDFLNSVLIPRSDGGFAIFLGDRFEFYSPDFRLHHESQLDPVLGDENEDFWLASSPGGKTILVQQQNGADVSCTWVVGETIASRTEKCGLPLGTIISDDELATYTSADEEKNNVEISVEKRDGPWHKLCTSAWSTCHNPEFLSDDTLFLWPGFRSMARVARDDGKTIFEFFCFGPIFVNSYSQYSHLLAVPGWESNGMSESTFAGALVFDVEKGKKTFQAKTDKQDRVRKLEGLSLSPSGTRLAIQSDGILRCFKIPQPSSAPN